MLTNRNSATEAPRPDRCCSGRAAIGRDRPVAAEQRVTTARSLADYMLRITTAAVRDLSHTQPWPYQFRRRSLEVRSLCRLCNLSEGRRILELGCGNAFGTALLAENRELAVATDLARADRRTHSIGLCKARALLDGLGLECCDVMAASGEALPYRDGSFDLVFSLFVLEHISRREQCLRETRRVLQPNGLLLAAVPSTLWCLNAPLSFYLYLLRRLSVHIFRRDADRAAPCSEEEMAADCLSGGNIWRRFRRNHPQFPLPSPHGEYPSYFAELCSQSRRQWVGLFERAGFEVIAARPTMMLPLDLVQNLIGPISLTLYERLYAIDQWLCDRRALRGLGQFLGIVARVRDGGPELHVH
jgi:SAM-dependent methyltransferase